MTASRWVTVPVMALALLMVSAALADVPGVSSASRLVRPVSTFLGLTQSWKIFAPEPRRTGIRIEGVVTWSDGASTVWRPPGGDPLLAAYGDYRWRKWTEYATFGHNRSTLWRTAARYIARRLPVRSGAVPVDLRLIGYRRPVPAPGSGRRTGWSGVELYRARLATHR